MNFQQFYEEYKKLKLVYPVTPTHSSKSEGVEYGDYMYMCKNAFFSFDNAASENIIYIFDSFKAKNCADGDYVVESELCYECVDILKCYNSTYLNYCGRVIDSHYCWDCGDSHNLFGCVHLNFKQYCIFNKQYTKEEYEQKTAELLKEPPEKHLEQIRQLSMQFPVSTTYISHAENADYGNHIDYSKNMYLCFDSAHSENGAYLYDAHHIKNSYDLTQSFHSELCYECVDSSKLNNCFFMINCDTVFDSGFCRDCRNSHNLFGCVALDKKEYCLLNHQYTKEEYEKQMKEIMSTFK
ncbi:MAG: hypothetical protein V1922_05510 [bacterium]